MSYPPTIYGLPFGAAGSGGGPTSLDLASNGTFTRSTSATYQSNAATDGTSAFISTAAPNVRRLSDLGDGNGIMLLMEGSRTNLITYSEDYSQATAWTLGSGATRATGKASPDGGTGASEITATSGNFGLGEAAAANLNTFVAVSAWIRTPSGTSAPNFNGFRSTDGRTAVSTAATTTYSRFSIGQTLSASQGAPMIVTDGRDWSGVGGVVAGARDHYVWGCQRENSPFASSYVPTTGASSTRGADFLSIPMSYCAWMASGQWSFDFAPTCSSTDKIREGTTQVLWSFAEDSSEYIGLIVTGGTVCLRVVSGSATKVTSAAATYSTNQKLTFSVNRAAGSVTVAGATTGNGTTTGTAWTFPSGNPSAYVGSLKDGTLPAFGRYGINVRRS